ncbi:MAG: MBL fold metallo-hydrolase [Clostridia bacterium]|nr:MBL fold metallo-hydrolase [Clostridia bacterium]
MDIKITDVRCQMGDASFLIDNGKTSILYDTGFGFTGYAVAENIKKCLGERQLDYIFLTHSHYDHALGSAYILRRFPSAKVVAGKYAVDIFKRDGAKRVMKELDSKFAKKCGVTDYEFLGDELKVDIAVDDGDTVEAGDMSFEVISLPGHTRCCVGYYFEKEGLLLSNETLGVYDGDRTILPAYLVSFSDTISSIKKIEGRRITAIVAPHLGLLNKAQTEYFLDNMKSAAQNIAGNFLDSIKSGLCDEDIIKQFKEKYWHGYIKEIYPEDAMTLNTSIMIRLIKNELL